VKPFAKVQVVDIVTDIQLISLSENGVVVEIVRNFKNKIIDPFWFIGAFLR